MIYLTENLRAYLTQDRNVGLLFTKILNFIDSCATTLQRYGDSDSDLELIKEFSIWYINPIKELNATVVYAIADTNHPIQFMQNFEGSAPELKLYLASNGERGYTLMLPEDY